MKFSDMQCNHTFYALCLFKYVTSLLHSFEYICSCPILLLSFTHSLLKMFRLYLQNLPSMTVQSYQWMIPCTLRSFFGPRWISVSCSSSSLCLPIEFLFGFPLFNEMPFYIKTGMLQKKKIYGLDLSLKTLQLKLVLVFLFLSL